jgi:hypothetical protein
MKSLSSISNAFDCCPRQLFTGEIRRYIEYLMNMTDGISLLGSIGIAVMDKEWHGKR